MSNELNNDKIHLQLTSKAVLKQKVYDNTLEIFNQIKKVVEEISLILNEKLINADSRIKLEFKDRGIFDCQLKVAGDMLVFSMHTNVFQFDRDHLVMKSSYAKSNPDGTYCGVINIYNFLSDSFKYNRLEDAGYLIARLFINKDFNYLVEGKRQMGFINSNFGVNVMNNEIISEIIETSILYSLEFDLLVPPYDSVKIISVDQINQKMENSKIATGKRMGFKFNADDIH